MAREQPVTLDDLLASHESHGESAAFLFAFRCQSWCQRRRRRDRERLPRRASGAKELFAAVAALRGMWGRSSV